MSARPVTITEEPSERIRSRLLAHRDRASQSPAAATPREFSRMDVDEPLLVHMHDILVASGRTIPSQQCAVALAEASSPFKYTFPGRLTSPK